MPVLVKHACPGRCADCSVDATEFPNVGEADLLGMNARLFKGDATVKTFRSPWSTVSAVGDFALDFFVGGSTSRNGR